MKAKCLPFHIHQDLGHKFQELQTQALCGFHRTVTVFVICKKDHHRSFVSVFTLQIHLYSLLIASLIPELFAGILLTLRSVRSFLLSSYHWFFLWNSVVVGEHHFLTGIIVNWLTHCFPRISVFWNLLSLLEKKCFCCDWMEGSLKVKHMKLMAKKSNTVYTLLDFLSSYFVISVKSCWLSFVLSIPHTCERMLNSFRLIWLLLKIYPYNFYCFIILIRWSILIFRKFITNLVSLFCSWA